MLSGLVEARKYRAGQKTKLRVSRMAFEPVEMNPAQIRGVRNRLRLSQPEFAEFLCTSIGTVRSWEQGFRSPHRSALRLLAIAKEKPALLLRMGEETQRRGNRKPRASKSPNAVRHSGMKQKTALEKRQRRGTQTSNRLNSKAAGL
jgi:putative transcriptional regulator